MGPLKARELAWLRLARDLDHSLLESITQIEPRSKLPQLAETILRGEIREHVAIDVAK